MMSHVLLKGGVERGDFSELVDAWRDSAYAITFYMFRNM